MSTLPTHTAWIVRESTTEGGKGFWIEAGAGWTNNDESITLKLDALPVGGKLIVRKREPKPAQG